MASPVPLQYVTSGQEFEDVTLSVVHTPTPEVPVHRVSDRVPVVVCPALPSASRGRVAHTTATSASLTTAGVSQRLRSVIARGDSLVISVPVYPEQRPPLGSLFDSLRKFVEQEKQQMVPQPVGQGPRLPSPKQYQPKPPRPQQQYQPSYQQPRQFQRPQYPQQQHHYPPAPYPNYSQPTYPHPSIQARIDFLQRIHRPFPFKRESVQKIFKSLLKRADFRLPEPVRPDEVDRTSDPTYCPYHRVTGHVLEDCVAFKERLEQSLAVGSVVIPDEYLVDPPSRSTKVTFDLTDDMSDSTDD